MDNEKKIVVLAGNRTQFQHWLRQNIIPITCKQDMDKLRGIKIRDIYHEGDYYAWADHRVYDEIEMQMARNEI